MRGVGRIGLASIAVVLFVGLVAPGPVGAARRSDGPPRHLSLIFVDRSRPTEDPTGTRSAPTRTLITDVYVPRGKGPFPLIAFAHGFDGNPGKLTQMLGAWAQAGFVVVAPAFPLTNDLTKAPGVLVDYANQPADVSFVMDRVIRQSHRRGSPLYRLVDARHVGMAGHSLGGVTALGATFNTCCRDRRIDAAVIMDSREAPFGSHRYVYRPLPLLIIHLTGDPVVAFSYAQELFAAAKPPKYLMALSQGVHFEPYEDVPNPHDAAVIAATTAFWKAYLRHDRAARHRIVRAGTEVGLSTVTAQVR
jgi:dienelactone hydrolase